MNQRNRLFLVVLLFTAAPAFAQTTRPAPGEVSLEAFDTDVAVSRREMRRYCGLVQALMGSRPPAGARDAALVHLDESIRLWNGVVATYGAAPPAAYAGDAGFRQRLEGIGDAMQQMRIHLVAARDASSFKACGAACAIFVSMHEENGLAYALDRIFHLRKLTRTVAAAHRSRGVEAVRAALPELLHQRDLVALSPCPHPIAAERCAAYRQALKSVSGHLADLAAVVEHYDAGGTTTILVDLLASLNEAYGLAL